MAARVLNPFRPSGGFCPLCPANRWPKENGVRPGEGIRRGVSCRGSDARFLPFLLLDGCYESVKALIRTGPWYRR
jgi:hypothetical protein